MPFTEWQHLISLSQKSFRKASLLLTNPWALVHDGVLLVGSDKSELTFIERLGIELISFEKVLQELCSNKPGELFCGAGTDITEIVQYRCRRCWAIGSTSSLISVTALKRPFDWSIRRLVC